MPRRRSTRGSRGRRRAGHGFATLGVTAAAILAAVAAVGYASVAVGLPAVRQALLASGAPTPDAPARQAALDARTVVAGVIVDPSGSNGGTRQARLALEVLATVLEGWAGAKPTIDGGSAGAPGLDLTIRRVATNSFAASAQISHIVIPSVPSVPDRPTDPSNTQANIAFLEAEAAAERAWKTQRSIAISYAKKLRAVTLPNDASEIAGAVSALTQVMPGSKDPRPIIVISDLEQAGAQPQVTGDLSNTILTVFQRCDSGVKRCDEAKASFRRLSSTLDGPTPVFERIENLRSALAHALKGQ